MYRIINNICPDYLKNCVSYTSDFSLVKGSFDWNGLFPILRSVKYSFTDGVLKLTDNITYPDIRYGYMLLTTKLI